MTAPWESETARRDSGAEGSPQRRSPVDALQAARERIALLERRELALRAALVAAGIDPDRVLARLDLDAPREVAPASQREAPVASASAPAGSAAPAAPAHGAGRSEPEERRFGPGVEVPGDFSRLPSASGRALARRLAEEVVAGPATLRLRAALRLVDVAGAAAAPAILVAAREATGAARASLLEQVGRSGAVAAAADLEGYLDDDEAEVRAAAVEALVRLLDGAARERVLRRGLEDEDPRVRRRTALCAASLRGLDPGTLLLPLLGDADRQVRRVVCTALGGSREPVAAMALLGALLDDDPSVRAAAGASAERLFGDRARGIAELPGSQRAREVARLRSWVAANLVRLAPAGRLEPLGERPEPSPREAMEAVLDEMMATGHPGAGFEDDVPGWTVENDPELRASFAKIAGGLHPWADEAFEPSEELAAQARELYEQADQLRAAAGLDAQAGGAAAAEDARAAAERGAVAHAGAGADAARVAVQSEPASPEAAEAGASAPAVAEADAAQVAAEAGPAAHVAEGAETVAQAGAEADAAHVAAEAGPAARVAEGAEAVERAGAEADAAHVVAEAGPAARGAVEAEGIDRPPASDEPAREESTGAEVDTVARVAVATDDAEEGRRSAVAGEEADDPVFAAIEGVLRAALRGATDADLAEEIGWPEEALAPVVERYLAAGRLVRRGRKLYLP